MAVFGGPPKLRYPDQLDNTIIVIEEDPEARKEILNYEPPQKEEDKPKPTETLIQHEVNDVPSLHIKDSHIKIGQVDVSELQQAPEEPTQVSNHGNNKIFSYVSYRKTNKISYI